MDPYDRVEDQHMKEPSSNVAQSNEDWLSQIKIHGEEKA